MPTLETLVARIACQAAFCAILPLAAASAAKSVVVYNFTGGADGATPFSSLVPDDVGNLYGTTSQGTACNCGTIFKIDKAGTLTTIHTFESLAQGLQPQTGVSFIRGLLYGNASGGTGDATSVFYSMNTDGSNYTILHEMTQAQGSVLEGLLQPSPAGGEFGLGEHGGAYSRGTLFYLTPTNRLAIVHSFAGGTDGQRPTYLIQDSAHTLFGSTLEGGTCQIKPPARTGCGTIFEYVPKTGVYTVLYSFQNTTDGYSPLIGAVGPDGTLYGVSTGGGADNHGALFALTPGAGGYIFSVLTPIISRFHSDAAINPPALSPSGALFGGTGLGGNYVYQNRQYSINYNTAYSAGKFLIPRARPENFVAVSAYGGTSSTCTLESGCGFIYYAHQ